jgi:hypothetical protein
VRLARENEGSFVASPADVRAIRLDPPSALAGFFSGASGPQVCTLGIEHARQASLSLALLSRDDVLTVVGEWAKVFGGVIKVNIAWSHSSCSFVATA